jgi:hypothetical protein
MATLQFPSSTGLAPLPDFGTLYYNGITFSCLYKTRITGNVVLDSAKRAQKYVSYTIYAEGIVDGNSFPGQGNSDAQAIAGRNMTFIRRYLSMPAGTLRYTGKGFGNLIINDPKGYWDVAYGPHPQVLEFQPLGGGRAAFIRWSVEFHLPEGVGLDAILSTPPGGGGGGGATLIAFSTNVVLEFTWEYHLRYDARGYSSVRISGTIEIPLTRNARESRAVTVSVDDFRSRWLNVPIDLTRYKIVDRNFEISRDKRTCNFSFQADELPPMGLPPGCTGARGTMTVRNLAKPPVGSSAVNAKPGLCIWECNMRCSYVVRGDQDRRVAFSAFYSLLWFRMQLAKVGILARLDLSGLTAQQAEDFTANQRINEIQGGVLGYIVGLNEAGVPPGLGDDAISLWNNILKNVRPPTSRLSRGASGGAMLTDFGIDEGLYEDSDTIAFHATWWFMCNLQQILSASGFNRWIAGTAGRKDNLWGLSVRSVMGAQSWLENRLDTNADIIVDIGGGAPWGGP